MQTHTDIEATAQALANGIADTTALERWYTEAVTNLDAMEWLVAITLLDATSGQARYDLPDTGLRILAAWHADRELGRTTAQQLDATSPAWRDRIGAPLAYVTETEGDRQFRLYPAPDIASGDMSFPHGLPLGIDQPIGSVAVAHTETRPQLYDHLALPVALSMLVRDFAREGRHRDPAFAAACRRMAELLLGWV